MMPGITRPVSDNESQPATGKSWTSRYLYFSSFAGNLLELQQGACQDLLRWARAIRAKVLQEPALPAGFRRSPAGSLLELAGPREICWALLGRAQGHEWTWKACRLARVQRVEFMSLGLEKCNHRKSLD